MPAKISPPGRILKTEIEARGWTLRYLAEIIECSPQFIDQIIKGSERITPEIAERLGKALSTSADLWINLEKKYQHFGK